MGASNRDKRFDVFLLTMLGRNRWPHGLNIRQYLNPVGSTLAMERRFHPFEAEQPSQNIENIIQRAIPTSTVNASGHGRPVDEKTHQDDLQIVLV